MKDKRRFLKSERDKLPVMYQRLIRLSADFTSETLQARRKWHEIIKVMEGEKEEHPTTKDILGLHLDLEGEIKTFTDKQS